MNQMKSRKKIRAFTILELLVVVAIIGILAVVALVNYNLAKAKSRDSRRFADVDTIATAMMLYKEDLGTTVVKTAAGLGTGSGGNTGNGWFNNATLTGYTHSISEGLVSRGFLSAEVIDPSGCTSISSTSDSCSAYYYQSDNAINGTVYSKLERPTTQMTTACTADGAAAPCGFFNTNFKINYFVRRQ